MGSKIVTDWHLRKDVTIGNILAAVAALVAALSAWHNLDSRVLLLEKSYSDVREHMLIEQEQRKEDVERVCARLDRIEGLVIEILKNEASNKK